MASLYTGEKLPKTSEEAIREFNERYLMALGAAPAPSWADRFVFPMDAPRTTFPIGLISTKFLETKEASSRFRTLIEKGFDLKTVEFDAGFEAPLLDLTTNSFAYRNWKNAPQRLVTAEGRHVSRNCAAILDGGTTAANTSPWDDIQFFHATNHLANPSKPDAGTFGNYDATGLDPAVIANITSQVTAMRGVPDENGDKLGVEPDEIWLPTAKFQPVVNLLAQTNLATGESNPWYGKLKPVHLPDLTDVNDWYLVDSKLFNAGLDPFVGGNYRPSDTLGLREWGETSDFFKDTGKIKMSAHIWYGFGRAFPHAIRRVAGA